MQEFDWKKEREKYRAKLDESTPGKSAVTPVAVQSANQKSAAMQIIEAEEQRRNKARIIGIISSCAVLVVVVAAVILYFVFKDDKGAAATAGGNDGGDIVDVGHGQLGTGDSARDLAVVADKYKHAVGAVGARYELSDGTVDMITIGTGWAFAEDKFATNAHVAIGLQDEAWARAVDHARRKIFLAAIAKQGYESIPAYIEKVGEKNADKFYQECAKKALAMMKKVEPVIMINGMAHKYFFIKTVAVHRDYGTDKNYNPDFAVLTIAGKHDSYFKLADKETLHKLKAGDPIAFLGFPTEGVDEVNVDSPVAIMQVGNITSVSGFDLKDAGPAGNQHIRHNLPATGGASGSPIFNTKGEIIAILWGVSMIQQGGAYSGQRAPNAALINFGVRVDLLDGVGEAVEIQKFIKKLK